MELDQTDKTILSILQEDAKTTHKELAGRLGLTITPVYERIRRLQDRGYIKAYVALVDPEKAGKRITVFCEVSLKEHSQAAIERFQAHVNQFDEIMECYHMAGEFDFLIKIVIEDMPTYQHFLVHKFGAYPEIDRLRSSFALTALKQKLALKF
jgi:Lrp/AsnC family leucine-responsive transcriptional regulator/Lrp/AsnC family transcriptional regulator